MRVARWGDSLAVRLPVAVVEALGLQEGDAVEVRIAGDRSLEVARDTSRARALERLACLSRPLPEGFRFDREEINDRSGARPTVIETVDRPFDRARRLRVRDPFRQ